MRETAIVMGLDGDKALLRCSNEACDSCSTLYCKPDTRTFPARNGTGSELKLFDEVEVYADPRRSILAGFHVLVVPLLLFGAGVMIGTRLPVVLPELASVLLGFAGLGFGFLLARLRYRSGRPQELPEVVTILRSGPRMHPLQMAEGSDGQSRAVHSE